MSDENLVDVDNLPGFKKDLDTGVIHNTNREALIRAKEIKKKKIKEKQEYEQLKNDVAEIKSLLSTLLNKIGD